jgi:hypothetical protein
MMGEYQNFPLLPPEFIIVLLLGGRQVILPRMMLKGQSGGLYILSEVEHAVSSPKHSQELLTFSTFICRIWKTKN